MRALQKISGIMNRVNVAQPAPAPNAAPLHFAAGEVQNVGQARQGCVHRTRAAHLLASAEVGALQCARNRQAAHSPHATEDHRNASTEAFGVEQNGVSDPAHVSVPGADGWNSV